jgi:hypothetical protein
MPEAYEAAFEELAEADLPPAVVIGIANDKTGE